MERMEYTLQDAFETLKESQTERRKEIEDLTNVIPNNFRQVALQKTCNSEDVRNKQHKLCKNLLDKVCLEEPKDYPVPKTSDLHAEVLADLEKEVQSAYQLFEHMKTQLSNVKDDISYLESKKLGLNKMRVAYLGAQQLTADTTYNMEHATAKRIFRNVKNDLELISSYTKGGNDLYVDVTPEILDFVNFLIEADIAVYHRNDKTKVKLMDML
ncbi:unnamed protein product [Heterotrigona itama]|uniref:Uncharacterized protein n=1 Tax=Heterotrigona itama TaxID=395501 RepID=A0A6V7H6S3_9HYME|nr:unnamed protein product [Heterotrigona itama]